MMLPRGATLTLPLIIFVGSLASPFQVYGIREAEFCEPITERICSGSGTLHRFTKTPIAVSSSPNLSNESTSVYVYQTQREAVAEVYKYGALLNGARRCRYYLRPFLCAVYLPPCDYTEEPIPPCRDLCERARSHCFWGMRHAGLSWIESLNCERFPTSEENPSCISVLKLGDENITPNDRAPWPGVSVRLTCFYYLQFPVDLQWFTADGTLVSEDPTQPVHFERTIKRTATLVIEGFADSKRYGNYTCSTRDGEFSRSTSLENVFRQVIAPKAAPTCETITLPYCKDQLSYTHAALPNSALHESQLDVGDFIQNVLQPGTCSPHLPILLCSYMLPKCEVDEAFHKHLPCRELCERVFSDCRPFFGLKVTMGLPPPCETFVYSREDQNCYNGVDIGPIKVSETAKGKRVEVECGFSAARPAKWFGPEGIAIVQSDHIKVDVLDSRSSRLIINNFQDEDSGVYTCSEGTFFRTVNITNSTILQDTSQTLKITTTLSSAGSTVDVTLDCISLSPGPIMNLSWLLPNGFELHEGVAVNNVHAEYLDSDTARLVIEGFNNLENGGEYTCRLNGHSVTTTVDKIYPPSFTVTATAAVCEKIKDETCRRLLGYDMAWTPGLTSTTSQADLAQTVISLTYGDYPGKLCSPYQQVFRCALIYQECRVDIDAQAPQLPCRELCRKMVEDCSKAFTEHPTESPRCEDLPLQAEGSCFNGLTISPVEYLRDPSLQWKNAEVNCTSLLPINESPTWQISDGTLLTTGQHVPPHTTGAEFVDFKTTKLTVSSFDATVSEGEYTCVVDGLEKSVVIGDDQSPKGSCQWITEGLCSQGTGYTHAYFPNVLGHTMVTEALDAMKLNSPFDINRLLCSPYTRPLLCVLYFPPCDPSTKVAAPLHYTPCRELCERNARACQDSQNLYGDAGCESIYTFDTGSLPCYDVDEIDIGSRVSTAGSLFVDCIYNLLPEYQPIWLLPDGQPVENRDSASRLRVLYPSPTVTRLLISDFKDQQDSGTYTCQGHNLSKTVMLGDGGVAAELEITIGPVIEQESAVISGRSVDCTYNLSPSHHRPTWTSPNGQAIPDDPRQNVHMINVSDTVTRLVITYYIPSLTTGTYTCRGLQDLATVDL